MADAPASPAAASQSHVGGSPTADGVKERDGFLPTADISRIMRKAIPPNGKIDKGAIEAVQEFVSEFISFITSEYGCELPLFGLIWPSILRKCSPN
jgi:hypothetical protein